MQFVPVDVESWKTVVDYPIIAFANKEKPQEIQVGHLTNGIKELVTLQINKEAAQDVQSTQLTKRFICFAKTNKPSLKSEINFIVADDISEKAYLQTMSLTMPFDKSSLTNESCW